MKYTLSLTFDSLTELQEAVEKLNNVNSKPKSKQTKKEEKPAATEEITEESLRDLLIKYVDSGKTTMAEIQKWMGEKWGTHLLKNIDKAHWPEIKAEVEAKL